MSTHLLTPLMEIDEDPHTSFLNSYSTPQPNVLTESLSVGRNTFGTT